MRSKKNYNFRLRWENSSNFFTFSFMRTRFNKNLCHIRGENLNFIQCIRSHNFWSMAFLAGFFCGPFTISLVNTFTVLMRMLSHVALFMSRWIQTYPLPNQTKKKANRSFFFSLSFSVCYFFSFFFRSIAGKHQSR